ncbi:hypothetical protein [Tepidimicrobium xylanilyticum]|uniref:Uncharacterized protein n=1 Tax=Tepidimicrobium xylanilyticum TaxID=1123352 RepID=A0A1H3ECF0_9FIRM|nr:hypothetical protein [Tepidimicrobium xylanilyticum]SDX75579.1 hypothetical protein SAMN05660923_02877 [Tepidimicrobium xylanilyticum]
MNAIGIYVEYKNRSKLEIEKEMKYAAEKIVELERIVDAGKKAEKELEKAREKMMELAISYARIEGDM